MRLIQKTFSEPDFYKFWLDFQAASKSSKMPKNKPKKMQKNRRQKNTKRKQEKASETVNLADESGRWGGYGGEKKPSKTAKNNAKN